MHALEGIGRQGLEPRQGVAGPFRVAAPLEAVRVPPWHDRAARHQGDRRAPKVADRRRGRHGVVGIDRDLGLERPPRELGDEHRHRPLGPRRVAHPGPSHAPRQVALGGRGPERAPAAELPHERQHRAERAAHLGRGVARRNHVGLWVQEKAGILGMHGGHRRDAGVGGKPAHLGAGAPVSARGECRSRDDDVRPGRLQPVAHRGVRRVAPLVEEVVAAHEGRDDSPVALEQRLERPAGADRALPALGRVVRMLLGAYPCEELVQVVSDSHHASSHASLLAPGRTPHSAPARSRRSGFPAPSHTTAPRTCSSDSH